MKKRFFLFLLLSAAVVLTSCKNTGENNMNPLLTEFDTPYGAPPFEKIKAEHFLPAYKEAVKLHNDEINKIAASKEEPTFENTVIAIENSGEVLKRISGVFNNLTEALISKELQEASKEISPLLSGHYDDIYLNGELFARVKTVYDNLENSGLDPESKMLVEKYYKYFQRAGAGLDEAEKEKLRDINKQLSLLYLAFSENVLNETNSFRLLVDNPQDLAGLPESSITAAQEAAEKAGEGGKWMFTLHKPSLIPFLQYSEKRDLREKMFKGYANIGNNNDENDNKEILKKIASLRYRKANLLGYNNYAEYVLDDNMAKTPANVYNLLDQVWEPALKTAKNEVKEMQSLIDKEGKNFKLEPWDWRYYAEKVRKEKFDLDDAALRPYFTLENVQQGLFATVKNLFGLTFEKNDDIPVYHEDVQAYEIKDADGSLVGIWYCDYFPRESKRGGAWMDAYRKSYYKNNERVLPIIVNVGNFSKPSGGNPAMLSLDETLTLFHEFGHALHGLLTQGKYYTLSGTSVARDFVELPSQIMENWALEPEVLKTYAKHYKTGEPIPDEMIEKLEKSRHFNMGFETVEYLAASYLDMAYHDISDTTIFADVSAFEEKVLNEKGLIPEIISRYRSPYFSHIFSSGGYATGYYSYIWAEVLDADAFEAFKEKSLFDGETALAFRKTVLEKGGSVEPMTLYKEFRGKEPTVKPLLKRRGFGS